MALCAAGYGIASGKRSIEVRCRRKRSVGAHENNQARGGISLRKCALSATLYLQADDGEKIRRCYHGKHRSLHPAAPCGSNALARMRAPRRRRGRRAYLFCSHARATRENARLLYIKMWKAKRAKENDVGIDVMIYGPDVDVVDVMAYSRRTGDIEGVGQYMHFCGRGRAAPANDRALALAVCTAMAVIMTNEPQAPVYLSWHRT